jgi:hypothetical protein
MRGLAGDRNANAIALGDLPSSIPPALSGGPWTSWRTLGEQKFPDASVGISFDMPLGRHAPRGQLGAAEAGARQIELALAERHAAETAVSSAVRTINQTACSPVCA